MGEVKSPVWDMWDTTFMGNIPLEAESVNWRKSGATEVEIMRGLLKP
jgi:hypothetical protein